MHLVLRLRGGGVAPLEFNSLEDQVLREFAEDAPNYGIINRGLNVDGKCINESCEAYNQIVWVKYGFG